MRRRSATLWLPLLLSLPFVGACEEDLTQIMVVVGTDIAALDGVRVEWSGLGEPGFRDIDFSSGRPVVLPMVHRGGSLGPLVVTARGLTDGTPTGPDRGAQVSFQSGEVRMLRLDLLQSCVATRCSPLTCVDGGCVATESPEAATLLPWDGDPPDVDGGIPPMDGGGRDMTLADLSIPDGCVVVPESCNGADDDCDGLVDEDFDFSSDAANCGECGVSCGGSCEARICQGTFVALAAGAEHTCATDDAGAVFCWGSNSDGQLGDGTTAPSATPLPVVGLPSMPVVQLAAGDAFSCARTMNGEVWCWGRDDEGQRGDGAGGGGPTPTRVNVPVGGMAVDVAAGAEHACLIQASTVYCWGANNDDQIGSGSAMGTVLTPEAVTVTDPVDLAIGASHSCALSAGGQAQCWGSGSDSQLGISATGSATPVVVNQGGVDFSAITGGALFNCALTDVGSGYCWGRGGDGALGYGATTTSATPRQVQRIGDSDDLPPAASLDAGGAHVCAVLADGRVACWGNDQDDQLGDPDTMNRATEPVLTEAIDTAIAVAAGGSHSCARLVDGSLRCWGANGEGQLGTGDNDANSVPVAVLPLGG